MFGVGGGNEVHGSGTRTRKLAFPKSLGAPQRHDVRTGRSGGRRFSLPPALALLPGARSLLAAGPALAQGTTPAALTSLSVENGARRLILGWIAPAGPLNGYDVHYTSAKAAMAAGAQHLLPHWFAGAAPRGGARRIAKPAPPGIRSESRGEPAGPPGCRGETHEILTIIPNPTRKTTVGRLESGGNSRLSERHVACPARTSHSEANRCNCKA